jgi:REP element-mobilizing transposase RayT
MNKNRQSIRLKNYDYSKSGLYFITICTQNRRCLFGNIVGANHDSPPYMKLNEMGKIVEKIWKSLSGRFPIELDEFQIMPNHVHMILAIQPHKTYGSNNGRDDRAPTLGKIIAYFKYESTKQINQYSVGAGIIPPNTVKKIFQRNYYEHIIRNEIDLKKIREYIINNPLLWNRDRNNPINVK